MFINLAIIISISFPNPMKSIIFLGSMNLFQCFSHGFSYGHRVPRVRWVPTSTRTWPSARTACRVGSWRSWCWPSNPRSSARAPRGSRRRNGDAGMGHGTMGGSLVMYIITIQYKIKKYLICNI